MDKCKIYNCGTVSMHHSITEKPQPSSFERHCHPTYEIMYVVNGRGFYMHEGEKSELSPNTLVLTMPCKFHYVEPNESHTYDRYVLNFSDEDIPVEIFDHLSQYTSTAMAVSEEKSTQIMQVFCRLEQLSEISEELRYPMVRFLIGELLVLIMNGHPPSKEGEDSALGALVIKYINERITSKITLDDIARDFFVSKSYLCRAFKEYNKISVFGYINEKRVAMARRLIEEGQNASLAAYSVGFADYSTFFRAYKRITGRAPTGREPMRTKLDGNRQTVSGGIAK